MKTALFFLGIIGCAFAEMQVLVFAASTRADSFNKKLAAETASVIKQLGHEVTLIDLKDYPMPFYDGDLEKKGMPKEAKRFRNLMIQSNLVVIASPEYNGSIPGILKNALDWASRDEAGNPSRIAYKDKQFLLMSASPGGGGGARALVHLRSVIENAGGEVLADEITVPQAHTAFTKEKLPTLKGQIESELVSLLVQ